MWRAVCTHLSLVFGVRREGLWRALRETGLFDLRCSLCCVRLVRDTTPTPFMLGEVCGNRSEVCFLTQVGRVLSNHRGVFPLIAWALNWDPTVFIAIVWHWAENTRLFYFVDSRLGLEMKSLYCLLALDLVFHWVRIDSLIKINLNGFVSLL